MKKLAKILALTFALVMCAVVLTACGATLDSMKKQYEDNGYTVEVATKSDEAKWAFTAKKDLTTEFVVCFKDSKDADKAEEDAKQLGDKAQVKRDNNIVTIIFTTTVDSMKKQYEDKGYTVEVVSKEQLTQMSTVYGEVEWGFLATKDLTTTSVLCFKNSEDAKKAEEGAKNSNSLAQVELNIRIVTVTNTTTVDSMKKKYEDAGYTVKVATKEELAEMSTVYGEVEWYIVATKNSTSIATVMCFKDTKDAEATEAKLKEISVITSVTKVERDRRIVIVATNNDALEAK